MYTETENMPIDFVVSWVDGNNKEWLSQRSKYRTDKGRFDTRKRRTRNWDNFKFWFRGIEKYAPWVNHIYVVTPGHYPEWLNIFNPKVSIIDQNILLDEEDRPTFNNCAIELLLHKIPNLAEHFVYFCDDMFLVNSAQPSDFFRNNLPLDTVGFQATEAKAQKDGNVFYGIPVMALRLVAKHFDKTEVFKMNWKKFLDIRNGKNIVKTLMALPYHYFVGFNEPHTANSYLKSTYEDIWKADPTELSLTVKSRFRQEFGLSQWAIRYWQICSGKFEIRSRSFSTMVAVENIDDALYVSKLLEQTKSKVLCINDDVQDEYFEEVASIINSSLDKKYSTKCSFEK